MRKLVNTVLAGVLGLSMVAGVTAQSVDGDATINVQPNQDGVVSPLIISAPNFGSVEYSLDDQLVTNPTDGADNLILQITDDRGGANGWDVSISGTDFTNEEETASFSVTNLTLGTGSVTSDSGDPANVTANADQSVTTGATSLVTASVDIDSNGEFSVTYTGNGLNVPGGTPVDEYTSTLTVSVTEGP